MFRKIKRDIRSYCYDKIQEHSAGTPFLYKSALDTVKPSSSILEVGIGNGICIERNANKIREMNLTIKGIDIDKEYLQICQQRIITNNLSNHVSCNHLDLLKISKSEKYDYVFFPGSYPVIPKKTMHLMLERAKLFLRDQDSKILFSHSLYIENDNTSKQMLKILDTLKKNLKYAPMIWTDFGRMTTVKEFEDFFKQHNLKVSNKIEMGLAEEKTNPIKKRLLQIIGLTFKSEHYIYSLKLSS